MDAIVIQNVSKSFRRRTVAATHTTLKAELVRWAGGRRRQTVSMTDVLRGIDLTIPQGGTFGIIGRNGSGKSTLLKLITGIYAPSSGTISVNGRISALLELGAGFHPDFSGRENILINGIILGMSRAEIRARTPEIIEFAELGEFIDEPVRTYSSGMFMRLAFAVATHVDPDILVVDEILAVGDDHFARKSRAKMNEFKDRGKTIVLVTHDLGTIARWCDHAAWLDQGKIRAFGDPTHVVDQYKQAVAEAEAGVVAVAPPPAPPGPTAVPVPDADQAAASSDERWGTFRVELTRVAVVGRGNAPQNLFDPEDPFGLELEFVCKEPIRQASFHVTLFRGSDRLPVWDTSTGADGVRLPTPLPTQGKLRLEVPRLGLADGDYRIDVAIFAPDLGRYHDFHRSLYGFSVRSKAGDFGIVRLQHSWALTPTSGLTLATDERTRPIPDSGVA